MSDQSGQPEPSMEEILASIRRIISEEAPEKSAGPQPTAAAPKPAVREAVAEPEAAGGDVLVLTEMVAEDGSVVTVDEPVAPAPPPPSDRRRAGVTPLRPDPVEATEGFGGAEEEAAAPLPLRARVKAPPPPETSGFAVEEPRAAPRPKPAKDNGLLSKRAAEATAAAFAQLSTGMPREIAARHADGEGVTLEAFVRQCLDPILREWLDANLPAIIERLMKEEIERVARGGRG